MGIHKLVLETIEEDDYELIAIHCSLPPYRLAFLLNKYISLKLCRSKEDIRFEYGALSASFPLFRYDDYSKYNTYSLLGNKFTTKIASDYTKSESLFTTEIEDVSITKYLIPELKNVDYFLKIESETSIFSGKLLIKELLNITQVVTTYNVDYNQLKSKNNLILE